MKRREQRRGDSSNERRNKTIDNKTWRNSLWGWAKSGHAPSNAINSEKTPSSQIDLMKFSSQFKKPLLPLYVQIESF